LSTEKERGHLICFTHVIISWRRDVRHCVIWSRNSVFMRRVYCRLLDGICWK
jgi:hypothetical protein